MRALLAVLRTLAGSACALAGAGFLLYGLVGSSALLLANLPGSSDFRVEDEPWIHTSWYALLGGLPLIWVGYVILTTSEDIDGALRAARERHLRAVGAMLDPAARQQVRDGKRPPPAMFGWGGLAGRLAALWAVTWLVGMNFHFWGGSGGDLLRALPTAGLLWLANFAFIFFHELGHLVGARLAGVPCTGVRVGTGPTVLNRTLGRVKFDLRAWPLGGGMAFMQYRREKGFRWRNLVVYAGGPVVHLLALAAVLWTALHASAALAPIIAVLVIPGLWTLLFGSLVPFRSGQATAGGTPVVFLDSAAMLNTPRYPQAHIRWQVGLGNCAAAERLTLSGLPEDQLAGEEALTALLARYPELTVLRFATAIMFTRREKWAEAADLLEERTLLQSAGDPVPAALLDAVCTERLIYLAMSGAFAQARTECLASLDRDETDAVRADRLDRLACLPLMHGLQGYWDEALDWITRARGFAPDFITLQGTHGSLLVETGRDAEARPMLEHVRATSASPTDQGICALFLAIIARRQARPDEAEPLAAEAFRRCPDEKWMRARWEQELSASATAPAA